MMDALKSLFVGVARRVFNGWYKHQCKRYGYTRENTVLFVSRQMDVPSENFLAVGAALQQRGFKPIYHTKRLTKKTLVSYTAHVFQEIALLAQASAVVLDRYDPVVSLLDFECEEAPEELLTVCVNGEQSGSATVCVLGEQTAEHAWVHHTFPTRPLVIQLWHAFGSFKKFGYQSLDTPEGHSQSTARIFRIHRNYSWVICTSEDNRQAFAEAFSIPPERVVPLGLPEFDTLMAKRNASCPSDEAASCSEESVSGTARSLRVLFAPTLRKNPQSAHPFHDLEAWWTEHPSHAIEPWWSYHPLERGVGAATNVASGLEEADVVVTDYSSLVYEAYVLEKPVLFYVPDIEAYRISPGLNTDPLIRCPELCFSNPQELQAALVRLASDATVYPHNAFDAFVGDVFVDQDTPSAERIAAFIDAHVKEN